jgi:hypothetical protein
LHKGRRGKILGVDQSYRRWFENNCADLGTDADELKRFERLDGLPHAGPAHGKFFGQLLFRWQPLARLYLPLADEVENVSDYLSGNRLSANQAIPPELLAVRGFPLCIL